MPVQRPGATIRPGFTIIELLVAIAVVGILMALLLPAVQSARESARRVRCQSQLKQLSLALHNYHDSHAALPIGSMVIGPSFRTFSGWGWCAMALGQLDQAPLYHQLDFAELNGVGTNRALIGQELPFLVCPSDVSPSHVTMIDPQGQQVRIAAGNYLGVEAMLGPLYSVRFAEVQDGLSNTLLLGEHRYEINQNTRQEKTSSWIGFLAFPEHYLPYSVPHAPVPSGSRINSSTFSSVHPGGAVFSLGDGQARFFSESMDAAIYAALATPSGNEAVSF